MNTVIGKIGRVARERRLGPKGTFILISFIIVALVVDTSIVRISAFTGGLADIGLNTAIFIILALIFGVGQYFVLRFVRWHEDNNPHKMPRFYPIFKSISIIQYVLISILNSLILQMILTSGYNLIFLEMIIWINYVLVIILLGLLSQRFFWWFKSNRNLVVLAYALAIMMISINAVFTLVYVITYFPTKPVTIQLSSM